MDCMAMLHADDYVSNYAVSAFVPSLSAGQNSKQGHPCREDWQLLWPEEERGQECAEGSEGASLVPAGCACQSKEGQGMAYAKASKELAEGRGSDLVRLLNSASLSQPKANILAAKTLVPPTRSMIAGADAALKDLPRLFEHVANCKERVRVQSEMLSSIQAKLAALLLERCGEEEHEVLVSDRGSCQASIHASLLVRPAQVERPGSLQNTPTPAPAKRHQLSPRHPG
jgi:hypothetical protein